MEQPEVMTVEQTAALLQLCRNTVYQYVREGRIPATLVGNKLRFSRRLVIEALEKGFPPTNEKR